MSERLSPSKKYKLAVTCGNHWASRGVVTLAESGVEIAVVDRNYSAFPFLWIEGHVDGRDYLLCGSDYQGHTVIDLATGKRRDTLMPGTEDGHGFCMADARYEPSWKVVIVSGCIWAGPYEFRLYDFAEPMGECPQLEMTGPPDTDVWAEDDPRWPEFSGDEVRFFQSLRAADDDDDSDVAKPLPDGAPAAIKVFRREGRAQLAFVEEQVSDAEREVRRKHEEGRARFNAKIAKFKAEDPLFLLYRELVEDAAFVPDSHESYGVTHDKWCPTWTGDETRWCRRIHASSRYTIDLDWAIETGPVKLTLYLDHKSAGEKFFPHSVEGMREAFEHAKALVKGGQP